ncbi:hypothetical protein [Azospirillum doebereinerae]
MNTDRKLIIISLISRLSYVFSSMLIRFSFVIPAKAEIKTFPNKTKGSVWIFCLRGDNEA